MSQLSTNKQRYTLIPTPFDSKRTNCYVDGSNIVIETIAEYLLRIPVDIRDTFIVTVMLPKVGHSAGTFPIATFSTVLADFDFKLYGFVGGLADENFVELDFSTVESFLDLTDTPNSYTGEANKFVKVKNDETGLEFITIETNSITVTVDQTNHNLSVGFPIRVSGTNTYVGAQADSEVNAEVVGYVTEIISPDSFKYVPIGEVITGVPAVAAGTVLFLSPTVQGGLTSTEPTTVGQVSKPLMVVIESGVRALFINYRGMKITTATQGDIIGAENLGTGEGVFANKDVDTLQFKSLKEGTNITITSDANEITINSTASGSGDVTGPSGATDGNIAVYNGATGKIIKDGGITPSAFVKLDQTTPQTIINGSPTINEGIIVGQTPTTGTPATGRIYWDAIHKTTATDLDGTVTLQNGQEVLRYVYNGSGVVIPNGGVVYQAGVQTHYASIALAKADNASTSIIAGIATEQIGIGSYGYITVIGEIHGLNTSAYTANDMVYLSDTSAGTYTKTPPARDVLVGTIQVVDATNGTLFVNFAASNRDSLKQNAFVGIDESTPVTISIDYSTRVLTVSPVSGTQFYFIVDGGGVYKRFAKSATAFPAFTDTSGFWYFYFDNNGTATATQDPWTINSFSSICPVYRLVWNATLAGSAKSVSEFIEYHPNTISADDHIWKHVYGAIWGTGFDAICTPTSGIPNSSGVNTCLSLTTGTAIDDNLKYTITNNTSGNEFTQDMGNITAASITVSNSGLFKIRVQDGGGLNSTLPATRFPFAYNAVNNYPQYITSTGTRTDVTTTNYFIYFVYIYQDKRTGDAVRLVSSGAQYTTLEEAKTITWTTIQGIYPTLTDGEVRPLYRLIFNFKSANYPVEVKYTSLVEVGDIRKTVVATTVAVGSVSASSVTFSASGDISSTNVQAAIQELDSEKQPLGIWKSLTGTYASATTFTMAGTDKDVGLLQLSLFTCTDSTGTTRRIGYIRNAVNNTGTITVTVVTNTDLVAGDKDFKVAYNRKIKDYQLDVKIPGQCTADTSYSQGWWHQDVEVDSYLLPVDTSVLTAAAGTGAALTYNVYKNTTDLFSSAPDMTTNTVLRYQRPTTNTISAGDNISLRIMSVGGATNYAADFQAKLFIIPQALYTAF